eukprot:9311358-Pyramimonas_sp.AAC.2
MIKVRRTPYLSRRMCGPYLCRPPCYLALLLHYSGCPYATQPFGRPLWSLNSHYRTKVHASWSLRIPQDALQGLQREYRHVGGGDDGAGAVHEVEGLVHKVLPVLHNLHHTRAATGDT